MPFPNILEKAIGRRQKYRQEVQASNPVDCQASQASKVSCFYHTIVTSDHHAGCADEPRSYPWVSPAPVCSVDYMGTEESRHGGEVMEVFEKMLIGLWDSDVLFGQGGICIEEHVCRVNKVGKSNDGERLGLR